MTEQPTLPGVDAPRVAPPTPPPRESADRRRTARQRSQLRGGHHPITHRRLHPEAASVDDRSAPGHRCGGCVFFDRIHTRRRDYPKCAVQGGIYITGGPASDCRAWWPACALFEAAEREGET